MVSRNVELLCDGSKNPSQNSHKRKSARLDQYAKCTIVDATAIKVDTKKRDTPSGVSLVSV